MASRRNLDSAAMEATAKWFSGTDVSKESNEPGKGIQDTNKAELGKKDEKMTSSSNDVQKDGKPLSSSDDVKKAGEAALSSDDTKKALTVFSFRGPSELVDKWRLYGAMVKIQNVNLGNRKYKVDDLWTEAIEEYISNHPLEGAALEVISKVKA